jgi:hypothetical protein
MWQFLGISVITYFLAEQFPVARNIILFMVIASVGWMCLTTPGAGLSLFLLMFFCLICLLIIRYIIPITLYLFGVFLGLAFLYMLIAGLGELVKG